MDLEKVFEIIEDRILWLTEKQGEDVVVRMDEMIKLKRKLVREQIMSKCRYESDNSRCMRGNCMYGDFLWTDESLFETGEAYCLKPDPDEERNTDDHESE